MTNLKRILTDLRADTGEARGALAVLALLGLVELDEEQAVTTGEVAGFFLDSLRAHLTDGVIVGLDWERLVGDELRGVDLIRVLEESRVSRVETPTPARVVQVVQGVIKAHSSAGDRFLMQYDAPAGRYQWIGGKQDPNDTSPEDALRREIYEELALDAVPGEDECVLSRIESGWPTLNLSATYGILTGYAFTYFNIEAVHFAIPTSEDTRWLTLDEIAAGLAADGRAVQGLGALTADRLSALPPGIVE